MSTVGEQPPGRPPRTAEAWLLAGLAVSTVALGGATASPGDPATWTVTPVSRNEPPTPTAGDLVLTLRTAPVRDDSMRARLAPTDGRRRVPAAAAPATSGRAPQIRIVDATRIPTPRDRSREPKRLTVPDLGIDLATVPTGAADDGTMQLPNTVARAGWYRHSSRPGDPTGSVVIAAHVDTRAEGLGAFASLSQIRRGAEIMINDRRGRESRYRVVTRRLVPQSRLPTQQLFARTGPARLVLITCGGAYDAGTGYTDNVVVIAERWR